MSLRPNWNAWFGASLTKLMQVKKARFSAYPVKEVQPLRLIHWRTAMEDEGYAPASLPEIAESAMKVPRIQVDHRYAENLSRYCANCALICCSLNPYVLRSSSILPSA